MHYFIYLKISFVNQCRGCEARLRLDSNRFSLSLAKVKLFIPSNIWLKTLNNHEMSSISSANIKHKKQHVYL